MEIPYLEDKNFVNLNQLEKAEYVNCQFKNCQFTELDLTGFIFDHCNFDQCNLSLVKLNQTSFRDSTFNYCKLLGLHFDHCNTFLLSFAFHNCQLNLSSFYKLKLKGTLLMHCGLEEVDFSEADLRAANFSNSNLLNAIFDQTILEKADFRNAYNYSINPERNQIKKAKFSAIGIQGLMQHWDIIIE
jgi:uncharacterized protein YjbI with pentapeptide repeats